MKVLGRPSSLQMPSTREANVSLSCVVSGGQGLTGAQVLLFGALGGTKSAPSSVILIMLAWKRTD